MIRPGVALAAGGAVVLTWLMAWVVTRRRTARVVAAPAIANAWRAAHSPAFRRAWRRYVGGLVLAGVAGGVGLGASVVLAGRPSARQVDERVTGTRDIMLCLDVSGSMMKFQSGLVAAFRRLVGSLHGDRVGLTMWDSTAISAFPLTDDYRYVDEQLAEAAAALDRHNFQYVVGTDAAEGSSLVGDGLASCAERFDRRAERRTRSIVLATDNQPNGVPVVTLAQAGAAVRALGAQIFAVAPEGGDPLRMDELRAVAESSGGLFVGSVNARAADAVAEWISTLSASPTRRPGELLVTDRPQPLAATVLAAAAAGAALAAGIRRWRSAGRLVVVAGLGLVMLADPVVGGTRLPAKATSADVLFVVDTTGSIVAEDYNGDRPRLEGVKADIVDLARRIPGARFGMVTFGSAATMSLPWTTDAAALESAVDVLDRERTAASAGTRLDVALDVVEAALRRARGTPGRSQVVVFMSDGEQTAPGSVSSFARLRPLVSSGVVFGYGTVAGGPMRENLGQLGERYHPPYLFDERTGSRALSHLDPAALSAVASQIGVTYEQRTRPDGTDATARRFAAAMTTVDNGERQGAHHVAWLLALVAAAILAWELAAAAGEVRGVRLLAVRRVRP